MSVTALHVSVIGPSDALAATCRSAERVGALLAEAGAVVVCGGLGGVMAHACKGAADAGGRTIGVLPGRDRRAANDWVQVAVPTGLGEGRNAIVATMSDAVIAIGGGHGTLAEIAFALRAGVPVVGLGTWALSPPEHDGLGAMVLEAEQPDDAVRRALELARRRR